MASGTILATGAQNVDLGDAGDGAKAVKVIHLKNNAWTGSLTIAARKRNPSKGEAFVAIPYKKHHLNAAVGDETYVSTPITGESLIEVPAAGMEIRLVVSASSAGSLDWDTVDLAT